MTTALSLSFAHGRAAAHIEVGTGGPRSSSRTLGRVALALVLPISVLLGMQAAGAATHLYRLDVLLGASWVGVLAATTLLTLAALALLVAVRLRVSARRQGGGWEASMVLRLSRAEALVFVVATTLVAILGVHLLADGFACANGVRRAC